MAYAHTHHLRPLIHASKVSKAGTMADTHWMMTDILFSFLLHTYRLRSGPDWHTYRLRCGPDWHTYRLRCGPDWHTYRLRCGPDWLRTCISKACSHVTLSILQPTHTRTRCNP
eukprot:254662-Pelagomonas_calceolata.AAC.3